MKKIITLMAVVALVGGAYADMYGMTRVGYGLFNADGSAGLVGDVVGNQIELCLVSGTGGLTNSTSPDAGIEWDVFVPELNILYSKVVTVEAVEDWKAYAYFETIDVPWQAYASPLYMVAFGTVGGATTSESVILGAVAEVVLSDRVYDIMATPEVIDWDDGGLGMNANAQVVIPEPATFGLMGIAGLGMFLARRKTRS